MATTNIIDQISNYGKQIVTVKDELAGAQASLYFAIRENKEVYEEYSKADILEEARCRNIKIECKPASASHRKAVLAAAVRDSINARIAEHEGRVQHLTEYLARLQSERDALQAEEIKQSEVAMQEYEARKSQKVASIASELDIPANEVAAIAQIAQQAREDKQAERATFAAESRLETVATYQIDGEGIEKSVPQELTSWLDDLRQYAQTVPSNPHAYDDVHKVEWTLADGTHKERTAHTSGQAQDMVELLMPRQDVTSILVDGAERRQEELQHMEKQENKPQAYRHTFDQQHIFYYHHSCVVDRLPEEVTFDLIALEDVPQVDCEYCYKPMHEQETKTSEQIQQAKIAAIVIDDLRREALEGTRLERCENSPVFTFMLETIVKDLRMLADKYEAMMKPQDEWEPVEGLWLVGKDNNK